MGTKMAVAFANIFMAKIEKEILSRYSDRGGKELGLPFYASSLSVSLSFTVLKLSLYT